MRRVLDIAGAIASIASLGLSLVVFPGFRAWFYPVPFIVLLVIALAISVGFHIRHRLQVAPADQKRLDRIFSALPREAIRRIEYEDFGIAWPADLLHPVQLFYNELGDAEHEFQSKPLERARQELRQAAGRFLEEEAMKAIMAPDNGRRWIGIASGELDVSPPEKRKLYEEREHDIHLAATEFTSAHDALVRVAKKRGFDLSSLDSDIPKPSWTGIPPIEPSPVQARWYDQEW
ncbi:MAG TPA: hypothetical protein VFM51_11360 [Solirubrobacterales bacterium]|nr:hypothetical protein [Solirubrobacterales bacterium]